jgi:hypothetical protein
MFITSSSSLFAFFMDLGIFGPLRLLSLPSWLQPQLFLSVSEMAELRSHGIKIPIFFPINANGIVVVSGLRLSIRFSLKASAIWIEREIFHPEIGLLVQTLHETYKLTEYGHVVWEFGTR